MTLGQRYTRGLKPADTAEVYHQLDASCDGEAVVVELSPELMQLLDRLPK